MGISVTEGFTIEIIINPDVTRKIKLHANT